MVPKRRIIGGEEVIGNEFPWQVALVKKGLYKPFCGGSLISDKHVLTAAHCTVDLTSSQVREGPDRKRRHANFEFLSLCISVSVPFVCIKGYIE